MPSDELDYAEVDDLINGLGYSNNSKLDYLTSFGLDRVGPAEVIHGPARPGISYSELF